MKTNSFPALLRRALVICVLLLPFPAFSQFWDSQTGLLQMPSGEMQKSGTFMITNNFINEHTLPQNNPWWGYNTFMYGFNITFFSRLEISYICVLYMGKEGVFHWPKETWGRYTNQDRHFALRVQLFREGEFGLDWMPSVVVGVSDPYTLGLTSPKAIAERTGNGFFNRNYICATKHFQTKIGEVGIHLGYQYNEREDLSYNAPCAGISWMPVWIQTDWLKTKTILEFDSRTINFGLIASIWKDHIEAMVELQAMKWISAGLRYKVVLKS